MTERALNEPSWQTRATRTVHAGRLTVEVHDVELPDGTQFSYEVDSSVPFAVAVLLLVEDTVHLTRQYRYPINAWIWDLPAGGGNAGESPAEAAARECEEETGLKPVGLVPLHTFYPNPGRSNWPVHVFLAREHQPGTTDASDPAETVRSIPMSIARLDKLIARGEIVDPALLVARAVGAARGMLPPLAA